MKPSDQDINDVIDRLTESPDDIVIVCVDGYEGSRAEAARCHTRTIEDNIHKIRKITAPFTDRDGKRWPRT